jgi:predicted Zn-dependent peptidase
MIMRPALAPADVIKEQQVILEEIKMVEDTPDDLVHEVFSQQFWPGHPLGRPILGTSDTVSGFTSPELRAYFDRTYVASNLVVVAAGHLEHAALRDMVAKAFEPLSTSHGAHATAPPSVAAGVSEREKDIEQSHVCIGTPAHPAAHADRHGLYVLNTILGGSMSSRLFQHIREERGLAYAVASSLTTYSDAGALTVYAGCATEKVGEVVDLTLAEFGQLRDALVPPEELRRAKDHLKGSLMLGLESTSSRMSHLARQILYFGRHFSLDDMLASIEQVSADDVRRLARELFQNKALGATVVGPRGAEPLEAARLKIA